MLCYNKAALLLPPVIINGHYPQFHSASNRNRVPQRRWKTAGSTAKLWDSNSWSSYVSREATALGAPKRFVSLKLRHFYQYLHKNFPSIPGNKLLTSQEARSVLIYYWVAVNIREGLNSRVSWPPSAKAPRSFAPKLAVDVTSTYHCRPRTVVTWSSRGVQNTWGHCAVTVRDVCPLALESGWQNCRERRSSLPVVAFMRRCCGNCRLMGATLLL